MRYSIRGAYVGLVRSVPLPLPLLHITVSTTVPSTLTQVICFRAASPAVMPPAARRRNATMRAMVLKHVLARDTFCPDEDDDEEGQHFMLPP